MRTDFLDSESTDDQDRRGSIDLDDDQDSRATTHRGRLRQERTRFEANNKSPRSRTTAVRRTQP